MNLFTTLSDVLGNGCTATITIAQKDGIMTVGVLPGNDLVKDAVKNSIVPLNISGTPEELDEGFVAAIAEPIKKTTGLLVDMAAYERAAEEAKAKSKMEEERKAAEKTRKEQYNGYVAQCLIFNPTTGEANSWVPSISDVFATDWELVM